MRIAIRLHLLLLIFAICGPVFAQAGNTVGAAAKEPTVKRSLDDSQSKILPAAEWQRVDAAVGRALVWLSSQQRPDGAFPTIDRGQPGVTSLCTLAFMAHGHSPGQGEYGARLERATNFILSCQKESGLISFLGPEGAEVDTNVAPAIGEPAAYSHAIAGLTLSEMYGMVQPKRAAELSKAIQKALKVTLAMQHWPKDLDVDRGGWRYVSDDGINDSDLSLTGWQLMFLRSARNAGFDVPKERIDEAVEYVRRTFDKNLGTFRYLIAPNSLKSRAMTGAGILALAHAGFHNSPEAKRAGQWMLDHSFATYNGDDGLLADRYHYSLFNACQGMYQMGSPYWDKFFPRVVPVVLANQRPNGSWEAESLERDRSFGNSYTTALMVLSLGAPNQFLPVFQR